MFDTLARLERRRQRNSDIPLFARIAEEYLNRGDLDRALELCREGCEQFPAYPIGFSIRSRCLEAAGELEEARAALDMSLRLDPNNPGGFARLSDLYLQLGVETLAVKCLERAANLDPFDLDLAARAAKLAQSVKGPDSDGAARELPVEPRAANRDAVETTGAEPAKEAVGEDTAAVDSVGAEEAEDRGAIALDSNLEETFASSFEETIVGAIDEGGSPGGLDPEGSEPFAAVEPMPEWAELEAIEEDPEPIEEELGPAGPLRQRDGKSGGYDEVAALGAELFGADVLGNMDMSVPVPPPRPKEVAPPVPATLDESIGDDLSGETVGLEPDEDVSALLMAEDIFGADESDDDNYTGDEELIGGPVEAPDVGVEESIADETVGVDEDEIFAEQTSDSDVFPSEAPPTEEMTVSQPLPAEEIVHEDRPVAEPIPTAAADHAALEPQLPVARLTTRDDTELLELFRAIGSPLPVEPAASTRAAADVQAEPVPTVTLAELYAQQGFAERAMVTYRRILAIEPDNEEVKSKLSMLERSW